MEIDFHAHILPQMDDGAKDAQEAISILSALKSQGIQQVVATPHFYPHKEDLTTFLNRRHDSYEKIRGKIDGIEIRLAAEVYLTTDLLALELDKLCLENTRVILIELPFTYWTDWVFESLRQVVLQHRLKPVIAHVERYPVIQKDFRNAEKLINLGAILQVNAGSLLDRHSKKLALNLIQSQYVGIVGSDTHNLTDRAPAMDQCERYLAKKLDRDAVEQLDETARSLLNSAV